MLKEEFEVLAGYEVSSEDYDNIIEPMYMAVELNKVEFAKVIDKKRFALKPLKSIENEMKNIAAHLKETCESYTDWDAKERLEELAREYMDRIIPHSSTAFKGGYNITTRHTMEHLGWLRGCAYPGSVAIYDNKYNTIKEIKLI